MGIPSTTHTHAQCRGSTHTAGEDVASYRVASSHRCRRNNVYNIITDSGFGAHVTASPQHPCLHACPPRKQTTQTAPPTNPVRRHRHHSIALNISRNDMPPPPPRPFFPRRSLQVRSVLWELTVLMNKSVKIYRNSGRKQGLTIPINFNGKRSNKQKNPKLSLLGSLPLTRPSRLSAFLR